jgi:hypothetical protein
VTVAEHNSKHPSKYTVHFELERDVVPSYIRLYTIAVPLSLFSV